MQECAIGLVSVRRVEGILSFAAPPLVRDGALDEEYVGQIVAAFGIKRDHVLAHQWVDNGPGWAVVQLPTAEEVLALEPDLSVIPTAMVGARSVPTPTGPSTLLRCAPSPPAWAWPRTRYAAA